jgi:hypothetical protein
LRIRYDGEVLTAKALRPLSRREWAPESLMMVGLSLAAATVLFLLLPGQGTTVPLVLGLLALFTVAFAIRLDARRRVPARFALNFATERMQIDLAGTGRFRPHAFSLSFDDVESLQLTEASDGTLQLRTRFKLPARKENAEPAIREVVLAEGIPPNKVDELRRFYRLLHNALGLRPEDTESAG